MSTRLIVKTGILQPMNALSAHVEQCHIMIIGTMTNSKITSTWNTRSLYIKTLMYGRSQTALRPTRTEAIISFMQTTKQWSTSRAGKIALSVPTPPYPVKILKWLAHWTSESKRRWPSLKRWIPIMFRLALVSFPFFMDPWKNGQQFDSIQAKSRQSTATFS